IDDNTNYYDVMRLQSSSARERGRYTELFDPYEARNARLDSIEEIHLVEGVDDDFAAAFLQEFTVYGGCKVNLNFANADQLALVIRYAAAEEDKWKTEGDYFLTKTLPLANYIIEMRQFNMFKSLGDFAKLSAAPDQFYNPFGLLASEDEKGEQERNANLP